MSGPTSSTSKDPVDQPNHNGPVMAFQGEGYAIGTKQDVETPVETPNTTGNPELDQIQAANDLNYHQPGGGRLDFGAFWNSGMRNWVLGAAAVAVTIALIVSLSSHGSSKPQTLPSSMTPEQAAQAQSVLQKQLAAGDKALANSGASAAVIAQSHNQVEIVDGTQIVAASRHVDGSMVLPTKVTVSGTSLPNQYKTLAEVDAKQYVSTLTNDPTLSDLTKNSAVIHGETTTNP